MTVSVVIPTCNRKHRVMALLENLARSSYPLEEVIVVDSGEERLGPEDLSLFPDLKISCIATEKSVCVQRNKGVKEASGEWIFVCDDDIEVPSNYLEILAGHIALYPETTAVSGMVLQKEGGEWTGTYPVRSLLQLLWSFIFGTSIWGKISEKDIPARLRRYYEGKGNHLSKAGWPVLTNFSGDVFTTPVFGLGASLIRREALIRCPYDEVLDRHGIGDNYGIALHFPQPGIYIINSARVYHHQESHHRLKAPLVYFRRTLALDYFVQTRAGRNRTKRRWLLWSLAGSCIMFLLKGRFPMFRAAGHSFWLIGRDKNPYIQGKERHHKIVEPTFN